MAAIMVDYENVCASNGLKGVEFLNSNDTLHIFYSACCSKIRSEYVEAIERSGCRLKTYQLQKAGKNALDFYIASECGILSQNGETQIAIISRDKGFSAVADFFRIQQKENKVTVVTGPSIEMGIIQLNSPEDAERRRQLNERAQMLELAAVEARYEERKWIKESLHNVLQGTQYEEKIVSISECFQANVDKPPKCMYTDSLHRFGRQDGTAIYRLLKKVT